MLGKTITHYHITSQLGEGGMGIVHEAEDTNLGRHVALKFLTPAMASDENLLQRFQREARAASALNHPNICTMHAIEQYEQQHFIVMELLDGESLADRIRNRPPDTDLVLKLGIRIANGAGGVAGIERGRLESPLGKPQTANGRRPKSSGNQQVLGLSLRS